MTDEEKAKEWVRTNSGYSTKEFHGQKAIEAFLAGLEAGKDMAETDLATVAYMQGAESGYNKAFVEADKNLKAIVTDFNKARELIEELSSSLSVVGECEEEECELLNRAEQFLRENE